MKRVLMTPLATMALCGVALTATPAAAVDSFFDVFTEISIAAPPYPTPPEVVLAGLSNGGVFVPTQSIEVGVTEIKLNGLPPGEPVLGTLSCTGGGTGGAPPSINSFFDVFIDMDLPVPTAGRRISDVRIVHPPATPPGTWRLVPINPGPPGSIDSFFDVFVADDFFDITYRVADNTGAHTYHMHGTSPSGRQSFFDVFVELRNPAPYPDGTVDSFFDVFVDFQMAAGPRNGLPDQRIQTTGTYQPGTVAVADRTWGVLKELYR